MTKPRYAAKIHRAKVGRQCQRRFDAWLREFEAGARRAMDRIREHGNPLAKITGENWPNQLCEPVTRLGWDK